MMMRRLVVAASAAGVLFMSPGDARADEAAKACAASFEQAQSLQKELKLSAARVSAALCMTNRCPAFVRDACIPLVSSIEAAQPTIVLSVQDGAGADLVAVRVDIDGQLLVPKLGADAVPVDPGEHTLRFTYADRAPIEQHLLVRVGEKNRAVKVAFGATSAVTAVVPPPPVPSSGGSLWPSLIVGAAGVVTIGVSIGVGVSAESTADNLHNTCFPRCTAGQVSSVNSQLIVSDVLTGAGIAMVGVAAVLFFTRGSSHPASAAAVHVAPTANGLSVSF